MFLTACFSIVCIVVFSVVMVRIVECGEALGTCTAQQLQQQRLGLVIAMMGECHDWRRNMSCGVRKCAIARATGLCFQAGPGQVVDHDFSRHQGDAERGAMVRAKLRPCVGIRGQSVMNMNGGDRVTSRWRHRCQRIQEHDGVTAAGQTHCQRRALRNVCCQGAAYDLSQRSRRVAGGAPHGSVTGNCRAGPKGFSRRRFP